MAVGMLYRGDGIKSIVKNPAMRNAYYSGTEEQMSQEVQKYYNTKGKHYQPERTKNLNSILNSANKKRKTSQLSSSLTKFKLLIQNFNRMKKEILAHNLHINLYGAKIITTVLKSYYIRKFLSKII